MTRAADRLGVTQSAVSHTLIKLRKITGDPLFVRSGQGITPTETALSLKAPVQNVLDGLAGLTAQRQFDPTSEPMHFKVAANDMQRDLLFPDLALEALGNGIDLKLTITPSGVPSVGLLRDAACDLIVTPVPPNAPDLFQIKLFTGDLMCFFDGSKMSSPTTIGEYMDAEHITVNFVTGGSSSDILSAPDLPRIPEPRIAVSNFSGVPRFIKGTKLIATQLEFLKHTSFHCLEMAALPFSAAPVSFYLVWHERSNRDPAHKWLRNEIRSVAESSPALKGHAAQVGSRSLSA